MYKTLQAYSRLAMIYNKRGLKFDFIAAIVVFLVAIPLCLGISLASGAPILSGILSGVIGGIVVGGLSGSPVSVSGPAAGMAAVVVAAIAQLGDFNVFLLALLLAGCLQMFLGIFRAGFIAEYVPSNVVQGLLCAIGILLIVKQLPLAFTLSANLDELMAHLLDTTEGIEFKPLVDLSFHINSGAMLISLLSLFILIYFGKTKTRWVKAIPGSIVVVIVGSLLNELFVLSNSYLAQNTPQLVNIPQYSGVGEFFKQLSSPTWSAWTNPKVYLYAVILTVVASLESLLNIKAGEKLDKKRTDCSKDRELFAQGVGNIVASLVGGIPITSVIVRTSVNIQSGAKTKMATIFHGFFILFSVMLAPHALNKIPIASLATILIYTGYKLTNPSIYKTIYRQGLDRFIPFLVTLIGIVVLNLLAGILIGLVVSLFFILKSSSQVRMDIIKEIYPSGVTNRLVLPQQITFLNKASLVAELNAIPSRSQLIIDARYSDFIDKEIVEYIKDFQNDQAPHRKISLNLIGFKEHYNIHNYIDFINVTTYDVQSNLKPHTVLDILREGNHRFLNDTCIHRNLNADIKYTAQNQHPIAVVLGCIDSRVPVETIFDMSFGDLFCVRIAGNVINDDVLASVEYACHVIGVKLIVVLGHTRCGAIMAACDGVEQGHITQLLAKIKPAIAAETETVSNRRGTNDKFVHNVVELNIANTLQQIYHGSNILKLMTNQEEIGMVGAVYDVSTGKAHFKDFSSTIGLFDHQDDIIFSDKLAKVMDASDKPLI